MSEQPQADVSELNINNERSHNKWVERARIAAGCVGFTAISGEILITVADPMFFNSSKDMLAIAAVGGGLLLQALPPLNRRDERISSLE